MEFIDSYLSMFNLLIKYLTLTYLQIKSLKMKNIFNQKRIDILKIYLDKKIVGKVYEYGEKGQ